MLVLHMFSADPECVARFVDFPEERTVMSIALDDIMAYHLGGKVGMRCTRPLSSVEDLCLAYTPGVAEAVKEIARTPDGLSRLTAKDKLVAVVSDGTAILGLGDLGAEASIPVMEGKAVLFKVFGDVDGWPVPLNHCRTCFLQTATQVFCVFTPRFS